MDLKHIFGRRVDEITTEQGQRNYYNHMNYWRNCISNDNKCLLPSVHEALEYIRLKDEKPSCYGDLESRRKYLKMKLYDSRYDWRPTKSSDGHFTGLISPTGEQILPGFFADVFTQFDAINNPPDFIPVFNGEAWGIVALSPNPTLMTEFKFKTIVPERWERNILFVQDAETKKWGAFSTIWQQTNSRPSMSMKTLEVLMPCIADDIYEDELMVDDVEESPSLFFMTRIGNNIGILTDFGYSPIIFDTYETDDNEGTFRLIRNDKKRARRATWWQPQGQNLL